MSKAAPGSLLKIAPAPQSQRTPVKAATPKLLKVRLLSVRLLGSLISKLAVSAITVAPPPSIAPADQVKLSVAVSVPAPSIVPPPNSTLNEVKFTPVFTVISPPQLICTSANGPPGKNPGSTVDTELSAAPLK